MKITLAQDQLVIDNSLVMPVATGAILALGGVAIGIRGIAVQPHWMAALGLALLVGGALLVVFSRSTHIVLSKSGDSSIASKTLFSESTSQTFALADVASVQLQSSTTQRVCSDSSDGSSRYETDVTSSIFLHTKDARRIALGSKTRTMNYGGMIGALIQSMPLKKEAEKIAAFVGVPMEVYEASNFGATNRA